MNKKLLGLFAGLAFALSVMVVPVVKAEIPDLNELSTEQLIAMISELLKGGSGEATETTNETPATGATTSIAGIPQGFQFNTNLKLGMNSNDVKYLQIVLNSDPATTVANTGAGSKGNETTYFGGLTQQAVVKFQEKYATAVLTPFGLTKGTGLVGTTTRAKLNEIVAQGATTTPTDVSGLSAVDCVTQGYKWDGKKCYTDQLPSVDVSKLGMLDCVTQGYAWDGTKCYNPNAGDTPGTPVVTPVEGAGMEVALASDSPVNSTLITGQSAAPLAKFVLTNKDSVSAKVTKVELQRIGISEDATLANVYLFDGNTRITDAVSVSQGKATFNNPNGIVTIPAGQSVVVTVSADIAAGAGSGQVVGVSLIGVTSNVEVKSLPIQASTHTLVSASLASYSLASILPNNGATDPQDDVVVWQAQFNSTTRDVILNKLTLRQINSVQSSDVQNFRLYIAGKEVAQVDALDADNTVTFLLNETVKSGRQLQVKADIKAGSGRTVQMSLRNPADISVKDSEYNVTVLATSGVPATAGALAINKGYVTFKKSSDSPSGSVSLNASDQLLAVYEMEAFGEAVKVETLEVMVTTTVSDSKLRNGRIFIDGTQYGSQIPLDNTGVPFNVNYIATPGKAVKVEVYADIYASSGTAIVDTNTITVTMNKRSSTNAIAQTSYDSQYVPTSNLAANPLKVGVGALAVVVKSSYRNQSIVFPQTDYKIGHFVVEGSSVEAVDLYSFTANVSVADYKGSLAGGTTVKNVYLVINGKDTRRDGSSIKSEKDKAGVKDYSFEENFELAKNQSIEVEVYADIDLDGVVKGDAGNVKVTTGLAVTGTGEQSGEDASVANVSGQVITYTEASITAVTDPNSPKSEIIVAEGTPGTASFKFTAKNDSFKINSATIKVATPAVVSKAKLMHGSTVLAETRSFNASSEATFLDLDHKIPANSTDTLSIALELAGIGSGGEGTGASVLTSLVGLELIPTATGIVEIHEAGVKDAASQADSTDSILGDSDGIEGNVIYVYRSVPTVALKSLPSLKLTNGSQVISKFEISASETGSIAWKQIKLNVVEAGTITPLGTFGLYKDGTEVGSSCTLNTNTLTCKVTAEEQIAAGKSQTYEVRAIVDGITDNTASITTNILGGDTYAASAKYGDGLGNFVWSDMSVLGHNYETGDTGSLDWANGFLVKNLPTSTQTMDSR